MAKLSQAMKKCFSQSTSNFPRTARGGLFRSLLLPLLFLVVVTASLGSFWTAYLQGQDQRAQFREILRGNAALMASLNLPMSERMMENFSLAVGQPIGAVGPAKRPVFSPGWEGPEQELARLACTDEAGLARQGATEVLAIPREKGLGFLVILNRRASWWAWMGWQTGLLFGSSLVLGGLFAFGLARRLVNPLVALAERAPGMEFESLPRSLTERGDELGTLARALQQARSEMLGERDRRKQSERLAMLGQITTGLAHEIKNPASAILVRAQQLEDSHGAEAHSIRHEAEEILSLVNQWMFIARPESPCKRTGDLIVPLRELRARLEPVLGFRQVRLELEVPESIELPFDQQRLMQALRNLIENGLDAMPGGGKLQISVAQREGKVEICVADEGRGFTEEALSRFAEPFYSEKEGGMGLGLALVLGVVQAHGGEIHVENRERGGALVTLTLPHRNQAETTS
ncbi:MAG: signal transduction histidine kinase [Akkermansiaceae bacterium]|jgi:signal transduction histidine kinase